MLDNLFKETSPGVYYAQEPLAVDSHIINFLLENMLARRLHLARICLHKSHSSPLMSMLVAVTNKYVYPPHKHDWKDENYTIIRGSCDFLQYFPDGSIRSSLRLDEGSSFLNLARDFHTLLPLTDPLVFLECTTGPYTDQPNITLDPND